MPSALGDLVLRAGRARRAGRSAFEDAPLPIVEQFRLQQAQSAGGFDGDLGGVADLVLVRAEQSVRRTSLPSLSVPMGSSSCTVRRDLRLARSCMRISFSMQREA